MNIIMRSKNIIFVLLGILLVMSGCSTKRATDDKSLFFNGTIEADDIRVGSRNGGRVKDVLVKEGDSVKKGQILIRLEAEDLVSREAQARGSLRAGEDLARQRQSRLSQLLAGSRPQEIDRARADLKSIQEKLALSRKDAKRFTELYSDGAVSRQQYDSVLNQVSILESQEKSAMETLSLIKEGPRREEIQQARADVDYAKSQVVVAQQSLNEVQSRLNELAIVAPEDGVVEVCDLQPGDLLNANQSALTLIKPNSLWIKIYVPENYLGQLKNNQIADIKVDSFPGEVFKGQVIQINRQAEFTPRNVQTVEERVNTVFGVKVQINNQGDKLRAGMGADVTLEGITRR